ncbi:MAG: pantoate--beta-alanine ligase [Acidimicrobiia bacterium]
MIALERVADLRETCDAARHEGKTVGLVPTMGFFHEGHRSLMRAARSEHDLVVVTIFVNPLQFGAGEDLDGYPRDPEGDRAAAEAEGVDVLFTPSVAEMYPEPTRTTVHVDGLTTGLCGGARPTHFDGVTTVVTKLFAMVGPCTAYFGRKDAQQFAVVRRMALDLDLPVTVVGCPVVRERDGVAMSSRNAYLSAEERRAATVLPRALRAAAHAVVAGERDPSVLRRGIESMVASEPLVAHEYAEVRRADDLEAVEYLDGEVLVAVAARVGSARLIDNIMITIAGGEVTTDLGVITPIGLARERRA